jgi:regulator of replication initiation timing
MENEMCSICQEDLIGTLNILTTKCNHKFHTDCYVKYINSSCKNCCPICRKNIFDSTIEIRHSNQSLDNEYYDYIISQHQTLVTSLRNENYRLSYENTSLLEKLNEQNKSHDKKINEIKLYDKKKYLLFKKK